MCLFECAEVGADLVQSDCIPRENIELSIFRNTHFGLPPKRKGRRKNNRLLFWPRQNVSSKVSGNWGFSTWVLPVVLESWETILRVKKVGVVRRVCGLGFFEPGM